MQLLNSRVKSEVNYGRKGHGGDSGADVPFLRTHAGGRSPRGLGRCERLSSRHHTLNTTARGCLCPRPAPPVRSQATRFQRLHAPAGRPAPSTGSRSAPPQPKAPCWPEAGFPDPEKAPWSSCRLGSHCPAVGSPTTQTVSALSVQAWNGSGTEEPPSHRPPPRDAVATPRI